MTPLPRWHFSENSSDLVAGHFPKSKKNHWRDAMKIANELMSVISAMCVPSALSYYIDLLVQLKSP